MALLKACDDITSGKDLRLITKKISGSCFQNIPCTIPGCCKLAYSRNVPLSERI